MRASEFITEAELDEYERRTDNSKQIFDRLKQLGYTMLGGGQDATVWSKDEGSVIKVLMPSQDREIAEKGFLTFYEICKDNPQNPHLPKFIDIGGEHHTVFEINGVPYRQIAMERLQDIPKGSFDELLVWQLSELATVAFIKWHDALKQMLSPEAWEGGRKMPALINDKINSDPAYEEEIHNLFSTMQDLYNLGREKGLSWDLHTENVMKRKDGTLVIVDPYFM